MIKRRLQDARFAIAPGTMICAQRFLFMQDKKEADMQDAEHHTQLTEVEASGGKKGNGVRYVLMISLFFTIIVLSLIWIIPALSLP